MMKNIILLFLTLFLTACATQAKYEAKVEQWQGRNINDLIAKWDYPDSSFKAPDGNTVYVYSSQMQYVEPPDEDFIDPMNPYGAPVFVYQVGGNDTITYWCKTFFVVNDKNIIIHWYLRGNNCVSE